MSSVFSGDNSILFLLTEKHSTDVKNQESKALCDK